ncbi:MAG TPA: hypothetical protein EYO58_12670 [Flavobacteriales bacterium]|nr:hypothetical protein [Flavobacteriales bacterium]
MSVLSLSVGYHRLYFFGNFDFVQSWPSAEQAQWSDSELDRLAENKRNYDAGGQQWQLKALLQAKFGDFAVRSHAQFNHYNMTLQRSDSVWYDKEN